MLFVSKIEVYFEYLKILGFYSVDPIFAIFPETQLIKQGLPCLPAQQLADLLIGTLDPAIHFVGLVGTDVADKGV